MGKKMPLVIQKGKVPVKIWTRYVEDGAMQQALNLSNLSFAFKHIALMPDVHQGYGMPIGGVLAAEGMIIPNAVGVDIGCGLVAVRTGVTGLTARQIKRVLDRTGKLIPVGFKHNKKPQVWEGFEEAPDLKVIREELASARHQLGSLGGGNHFYSIEQGSDGYVWLMVHSGSRNIGFKTARYYNQLARKLNKKYDFVPAAYDLAALPFDSEEGREYFEAMEFCLRFARANRELILSRFFGIFAEVTGTPEITEKIDIHHNYAALETHFGKKVIVHQKGATRAGKQERGIIPGSMGTPSYIVEGLGNPESFESCAHGAGRAMSRKEANRTINREKADRTMQGIVFKGWRGDYSEAPLAYKDIEEVMANQSDLVKPLVKLIPLGVKKG